MSQSNAANVANVNENITNQVIFNNTGDATVNSRFGEIKINQKNIINFSSGLLGMQTKQNFCLSDFPNPKYSTFKILQSSDDSELAFIVLPVASKNNKFNFYNDNDIKECSQNLGIEASNMAILLITSVHPSVEATSVYVSVNLRAPLILDIKNQTGVQYVLSNNAYSIRHILD
jgi:flagellar assembly factor FliW